MHIWIFTIERRTAEETFEFARVSENTSTPIFVIKREIVFGKPVGLPDNTAIDWIHGVCEEIMKWQLFNLWLDNRFSGEQYSLWGYNKELGEVYISIKVPHDFAWKPWSFSDSTKWKASEFCIFVLFTGLSCLVVCSRR